MKNIPWIATVELYKLYEKWAHINLDDVINKVSQEVIELSEALEGDRWDMIASEAGDVLINISSVAQELWCDMNRVLDTQSSEREDLYALLWAWNEQVQALRGRYSRKQWSVDQVETLTKDFISTLLNYTDPDKSLHETLQINLRKLIKRKDMYKPDINPKDYIAEYPDFPKPGINFKDISPLLLNPDAMAYVCHEMAEKIRWADKIVMLDSRWFLFGPKIGEILWIGTIMARKPGKLPSETVSISYDLEYGSNTIEIQKYDDDGNENILPWEKIAIVDDLLATWGTAMAAIKLVEKLQWEVSHAAFVIWLDEEFLLGQETRKELEKYNYSTVVSYDD